MVPGKVIGWSGILLTGLGLLALASQATPLPQLVDAQERQLREPSISVEKSNSPSASMKLDINLDELEIRLDDMPLSLTLGSDRPPKDLEFTLSGGDFSFMFDDLLYFAERKSPFQMAQRNLFPRPGQLRELNHSDQLSFYENPFVFLK
ncbi:hypothetical protein Selin_2510 [Desulfurispirillum indicum S5]|uniref:Uncharacterized protein n=2 Tax=Desulfurispirillum TaxID=393029 RepID=E6W5T8_DESIS|nr:hypothetical protein Selin_2510 [Desulfurispirillum indicum S5]